MAIYASSRKKRHSFFLPILIAVLFALAILAAVWLTKTIVENQLAVDSGASTANAPAAEAAPVPTASAPPADRITFTENSMLNLTYQYSCGHTSSAVEKVPAGFVGKTLEEAAQAFPEYNIISFSPGTTVAEKKVNEMCDQHYVMKLEGEKLVVTQRNDPQKIRAEMPLDINMLPLETIEILNKGLNIDGETELLEFMEDFAS